MKMVPKKILVLSPHTDDGELGCGGTIHKLIQQGHEIFWVAFSICRQSVPSQYPSDILATEVKSAIRILGVKQNNLIIFDYDVRTFGYRRQDILEDLIRIRGDLQPDLVFLPGSEDIHQDHQTISQEGLRAFKASSILAYELPWNNTSFRNSSFVKLSQENLRGKIDALAEYKSQSHRTYTNENFLMSLATVRGTQIGQNLAEAFEVVRLIIDI